MNSIGNDVIALAGIQPERTRQYRFYSKILSSIEQDDYYCNSESQLPFEHYVWLLWSVKESAYKFFKRMQPELVFSPTRIIVQQLNATENQPVKYTGIISYRHNTLVFESVYNDQYIHTVVDTAVNLSHCIYQVRQIAESSYAVQSAAVRQAALEHINLLLPEPIAVVYKNSAGCPELRTHDQTLLNIPLSLSHDGNYIAYAFKIISI